MKKVIYAILVTGGLAAMVTPASALYPVPGSNDGQCQPNVPCIPTGPTNPIPGPYW